MSLILNVTHGVFKFPFCFFLVILHLFKQVNGRLVLEGALRIHWGVLGMIHLKEDDDQRTVVTIRKRNSCRSEIFNGVDFEVSVICSSGQVHVLQNVLLNCLFHCFG